MNTKAESAGMETVAQKSTPWIVPCRGPLEMELDELKNRLLQPIVRRVRDSSLVQEIGRSANEAAALAWYTACPLLVLPALLEEKVLDTLKKWHKQELLLRCFRGPWRASRLAS